MDDPQKERPTADSEPAIKPAEAVEPEPPDVAHDTVAQVRVDTVAYGAPILANAKVADERVDEEQPKEGSTDPRGY